MTNETDYQKLLMPRLAARLAPEEVRRWFEPLRWSYDQALGRLRLLCPTAFHQKKLAGAYSALLLELAAESGRPLGGLSLETAPGRETRPALIEIKAGPASGRGAEQRFPPLNGSHSFDRFIQGPGNRLAAFALASLAGGQEASSGSGSLFLTAPGPWGKSHLLDALALRISQSGRRGLMKLSAGPDWPDPPARMWAEAEIIIADDVQRLENRPDLQRRLIQAFDEANARPLTLVFSAPAPPQRLAGLSEPLRSRLGGGLVLSLAPPEYELMLALAQRRAAELDLSLPPEIPAILAREAKNDPRRLAGFLETLAFISRRCDLAPAKALAFLGLDRPSDPDGRLRMDMESILRGVAGAFGLKTADLTGHSRLRQAAWPRRVAMLLARELTGLTTTEIGEAFGGRDHSTVTHALKKVRQELQNPGQIQMVENIKQSLLLSRSANF